MHLFSLLALEAQGDEGRHGTSVCPGLCCGFILNVNHAKSGTFSTQLFRFIWSFEQDLENSVFSALKVLSRMETTLNMLRSLINSLWDLKKKTCKLLEWGRLWTHCEAGHCLAASLCVLMHFLPLRSSSAPPLFPLAFLGSPALSPFSSPLACPFIFYLSAPLCSLLLTLISGHSAKLGFLASYS